MENIMRTKLTACALVTTLAITGCANMNDTQKKRQPEPVRAPLLAPYWVLSPALEAGDVPQ